MAWSLSNSEMSEVREAFMELDADKSLGVGGSWMLENLWGESRKRAFFLCKNNVGFVSFQKKREVDPCVAKVVDFSSSWVKWCLKRARCFFGNSVCLECLWTMVRWTFVFLLVIQWEPAFFV